jgi:hypothetical protein
VCGCDPLASLRDIVVTVLIVAGMRCGGSVDVETIGWP